MVFKMRPSPHWRSLQRSPDPAAELRGGEGKGRGMNGMREDGGKGRWRENRGMRGGRGGDGFGFPTFSF